MGGQETPGNRAGLSRPARRELPAGLPPEAAADVDWSDWPEKYPRGGLLFHGDNKDVLAHLLANGFRGKVKLIYIDPPLSGVWVTD